MNKNFTTKIKKKNKTTFLSRSPVNYLGYKFRIYPDKSQRELIEKTFGSNRLLWNKMLSDRRDKIYKSPREYKIDFPFLKEVDSSSLCNTENNLRKAIDGYFQGIYKGYPKLKKRKSLKHSYTTNFTNNNIRLGKNFIRLPKLGNLIKMIKHRLPKGILKSVVISRNENYQYYVSIKFQISGIKFPTSSSNKSIGIDMGIKNLYTDSNGVKVNNIDLTSEESKVKHHQKSLSRKKKYSKNYEKTRVKLNKSYQKIINKREDYLHKVSKSIVNENQVICIETLDVNGMIRKKRKAINRSIRSACLGKFINYLVYKSTLYGRELKVVNKYFPSSQLCSNCGYKNSEVKDLSIREWTCPNCGQVHDRDINAAINILKNAIPV